MTPLLSVIIVSYNSWPYVGNCIGSLYDHPPADRSFEVILIDNASSDGTAGRVRTSFPDVQVIASETNDGYGTAVNRAVESASGDRLVLLNPDCEVTPGALDAMVQFLDAAPKVGIVGPRLRLPTGATQPSARRFPSSWRLLLEVSRFHRLTPSRWRAEHLLGTYWDQFSTRRVDWLAGACHVLPRRVWDEVGPLTEKTFCGYDDFDYCYRAARSGFETWLCAEATVVHHLSTSLNARWDPSQVDELMINNLFVVLGDLWPRWRATLLALSEAAVAASNWATTVVRCGSNDPDRRRERALRARQMALLLSLAGGHPPTIRCEPGTTPA